ncbi:MAG TPA: DUF3617 family protein [Caulobacteraceae bacterium]|nr:DUF3617 family protein [Caulobacteraceae bacterium]
MRLALPIAALAVLAGCAPKDAGPPQASKGPSRRPGLWQETISRDGKGASMGDLKICLDRATDERLGLFGRAAAGAACPRRTVTRLPGGGYAFSSTCMLGKAGTMVSRGFAQGDFSSSYRIQTDSIVSGAAWPGGNGRHHTVVLAKYLGPCPSDMAPGDAMMGDLRVNVDRLGAGAAALGINP